MKKRKLLLRIEGCPYCARVERELEKRGVDYEKVEIERNDRKLVELLSGQPTVPVWIEVVGAESQDDDIMQYLESVKSL